MKQALHILRKDIRRLWMEILLGIVALGFLTWCEWWLCTPLHESRWYTNAGPMVLVVFVWWFTVVRLIHGETLVGSRQFWITRPYVWYKLLAAKVLFVIVFIAVPLVLSQVVLLIAHRASLAPLLGSVLARTFVSLLILNVPVAALAAITEKLSQWIIGAIGVILVIIGLVVLDEYIPNSHVSTGSNTSEFYQLLLFASLTSVGIVLQYARRRRWLASLAMALGVVAVPLLMAATPYRADIARAFPVLSSEQLPSQIVLQPHDTSSAEFRDLGADKEVTLELPLQVTNVPAGTLLQFNGVMLAIDTPDHQHWESEWRTAYRQVLEARDQFNVEVKIDRALFERMKGVPSAGRLSVAFTELHETKPRRIVLQDRFELPGVGHCWLERDRSSIRCRSTENGPSQMLLTVSETESTCPVSTGKTDVTPGRIRDLSSNAESGPFSPLTTLTFSRWQWNKQGFNEGWFCPGTPADFSTPEETRRAQVQLQVENLRIEEYAAGTEHLRFEPTGPQ